MDNSLARKIRGELARYLHGEVSLQEFAKWLAPLSWNIEQSNEPDALGLAYEVQLRLAEFSAGHWTEPELRGLFASLGQTAEARD